MLQTRCLDCGFPIRPGGGSARTGNLDLFLQGWFTEHTQQQPFIQNSQFQIFCFFPNSTCHTVQKQVSLKETSGHFVDPLNTRIVLGKLLSFRVQEIKSVPLKSLLNAHIKEYFTSTHILKSLRVISKHTSFLRHPILKNLVPVPGHSDSGYDKQEPNRPPPPYPPNLKFTSINMRSNLDPLAIRGVKSYRNPIAHKRARDGVRYEQRAVSKTAVQITSLTGRIKEGVSRGAPPGMENYSPQQEQTPGTSVSADSPGNYESLNVCCSRQVTVSRLPGEDYNYFKENFFFFLDLVV